MVYNVTDGKITIYLFQSPQPQHHLSLNKIVYSTSYYDARRGRALLASYVINKSQHNLTPIRVTFELAQVKFLY